MRTTIKDVAKASGYSVTAVSLVLNNRPVRLSEEARARIIRCARELDYRPNQLAVSIVTKRSRVLGLIIPDNANQFFSSLSKRIENAARASGYALIYGNTDDRAERDLNYIQMFTDYQVDGVIYTRSSRLAPDEESLLVRMIRSCGIPFVALDRVIEGERVSSVVLDYRMGGRLATRHLIERGHRRIACLTGPLNLSTSRERLDGYRAALREAGIDQREELVFEGTFHIGEERRALGRFLQAGATAVFCSNDEMAFSLYREARGLNVSIPRQLSVVGFDNTPLCDLVYPALTSVSQPIDRLGDSAVQTLLDMIAQGDNPGKSEQRHRVFEPELVVRDSVRTLCGD